MAKIDCNLTLNYVQEFHRMCRMYFKTNDDYCRGCPFGEFEIDCGQISEITQTHIDLLQKWSDEHPLVKQIEIMRGLHVHKNCLAEDSALEMMKKLNEVIVAVNSLMERNQTFTLEEVKEILDME